MEKFIIDGGIPLKGEVEISGAKNAAIALIPAAILSDGVCRIENIPNISDVSTIVKILYELGADIKYINKSTIEIDPKNIRTHVVPYSMTKHTRASSYFMGAMLGRFHKADIARPGGCDFGVRPIDQHIKGFEALGAHVDVINGCVRCVAKEGLHGANVYMDVVTVGATINIMLAAVLAEGQTVIENAAREPEVVDLADCLIAMGAKIRGAGTPVIEIEGVDCLHGAEHSVLPDRIETGSFLVAALMTRGDVTVTHAAPHTLDIVLDKLREAGANIRLGENWIRVSIDERPRAVSVRTVPHPGFPTDMQAQFMALDTIAQGTGRITETIFENRFMHVPELQRLGANITVDGHTAVVTGVESLSGANVMATDLRASASLVIAGLVASGETIVDRIYHLDRGYDHMEVKLAALGAQIERIA